MSSTQRPRRRLALRDNAPRTGRQALAVAGLWLLIAIAAALGAILVLIDVRPHLARAVGSPLLVLLSVLDRAVRTLPLISLPATPTVSSFRGYWGLDNNLSLIGIGPARTGAGPPAPPNQGPWKEPLVKMLCSDSWLHTAPIDRSETSWICPGA